MADNQPPRLASVGQIDASHTERRIDLEVPDTSTDQVGLILGAAASAVNDASPDRASVTLVGSGASVERANLQSVGTHISARVTRSFDLKSVRFWGLPGKNPHFTSRRAELDQLAHQLQSGSNNVIGQSVSGLGGVGKTQLALAFAHAHHPHATETTNSERYNAILWLRGALLSTQTIELGKALGINTDDFKNQEIALCQTLCGKLEALGKRCLLVFDDVAQESDLAAWGEAINRYRSNTANTVFHVLATSRSERWEKWPALMLDVFSESEAREFVKSRLSALSNDEADQLASLVYHFPLALAQAVGYINTNRISVTRYCALYQENHSRQASLLKVPLARSGWGDDLEVFFEDERQKATYHTWYLSVEMLRTDCPLAETVLNLCAFLAPEAIPCFLLTDERSDDGLLSLSLTGTWQHVLAQLRQYSLVTFYGEADVSGTHQPFARLDIHQLLQEVIRLHLQKQSLSDGSSYLHFEALPPVIAGQPPLNATNCHEHYGRYVLLKLRQLFGYDMAKPATCHTAASLFSHGKQIATLADRWHPPITAGLWNTLGCYQSEAVGNAHIGRDCLERALTIRESCHGQDHIEVATTLNNLACAYSALGDPTTQKTLLERALTIKEAYYGQDHVEVAKTLNNLANAYGALGDHQTKKTMLERALAILESYYGQDHVEVAKTEENLANAYGALGDHQTEKTLLERILRIREAYYGKDHVEVAKTEENLAVAYGALGDHQTEKTMLERALALKEAYYGKDHVKVAGTLNNLANAHGALGDHQTEENLLERALTIMEACYGKDHVEVAKTRNNLAIGYGNLGDHVKAKTIFEHVLTSYKAYYGSNHVIVANTESNLAIACSSTGELERAKMLVERAYQCYANHPDYGLNHPSAQQTVRLRAHLQQQSSAPLSNSSGSNFTEAVARNPRLLLTRAQQFRKACEWDKAIQAYEHYLQLPGQEEGSREAYAGLVRCCLLQDNRDKAEQVFGHGLAVAPTPQLSVEYGHFLYQESRYAQALTQLMAVFVLTDEEQAAPVTYSPLDMAVIDDGLRTAIDAFGSITLSVRHLAHYLSIQCHLAQNDITKAEKQLATWQQQLGREQDKEGYLEPVLQACFAICSQRLQAKDLCKLAADHYALGETAQAKVRWERALTIMEACYGKDHVEVAKTRNNLAIGYGNLGDHVKAKTIFEHVLTSYKAYYGSNHVIVANTESNLAIACSSTGELERAKMLVERAYQCYANHPDYGLNHPSAQQTVRLRAHLQQQSSAPLSNSSGSNFTEAVARNPRLLLTRAQQFRKACEWDKAIQAYEHYLQLPGQEEGSREAYAGLVRCCLLQDNRDKAEQVFGHGLAVAPTPQLSVEYGHFLYQESRYAQALTQLMAVFVLTDEEQAAPVTYSPLDMAVIDDGLRTAIDAFGPITLSVGHLAHYLSVKCHLALDDVTAAEQQLSTWQEAIHPPVEGVLGYCLAHCQSQVAQMREALALSHNPAVNTIGGVGSATSTSDDNLMGEREPSPKANTTATTQSDLTTEPIIVGESLIPTVSNATVGANTRLSHDPLMVADDRSHAFLKARCTHGFLTATQSMAKGDVTQSLEVDRKTMGTDFDSRQPMPATPPSQAAGTNTTATTAATANVAITNTTTTSSSLALLSPDIISAIQAVINPPKHYRFTLRREHPTCLLITYQGSEDTHTTSINLTLNHLHETLITHLPSPTFAVRDEETDDNSLVITAIDNQSLNALAKALCCETGAMRTSVTRRPAYTRFFQGAEHGTTETCEPVATIACPLQ